MSLDLLWQGPASHGRTSNLSLYLRDISPNRQVYACVTVLQSDFQQFATGVIIDVLTVIYTVIYTVQVLTYLGKGQHRMVRHPIWSLHTLLLHAGQQGCHSS